MKKPIKIFIPDHKSNLLLLNVLKYENELQSKFNELKVITGCPDSYLNDLYEEAKNRSISIIDLIYEKIEIYNNTLIGRCEELRKLFKKSIIERLIEVFRLNKFGAWLETKLKKYF